MQVTIVLLSTPAFVDFVAFYSQALFNVGVVDEATAAFSRLRGKGSEGLRQPGTGIGPCPIAPEGPCFVWRGGRSDFAVTQAVEPSEKRMKKDCNTLKFCDALKRYLSNIKM